MRDTSLNLIAITIFTLTLTTLVAPLLEISATVPAGMVFVLLGLATLDTFSLQGQGATILVDWLAGASGSRRDRIVHHEAGHFLMAYLLGIPVEGYALTAWEAFRQGQKAQGGVRFNDVELMEQLNRGVISSEAIDKYCKVWMAGIAAEILVYDHALGGVGDRQNIRRLWTQLGRSPQDAQIKERWAILQAQTLLKQNWCTYEALVGAMAEGASVTECYRLIGDRQAS